MDNVTKVLGLEADELEGLVSDIQQHAGIANPEPQHVYTAWVYKSVHEALMADAPDSLGQFQEAANVILSSNLTSKEDIRHIIREAYADDSTRKVGRKVAEKAKASQAPQTASAARQRELVSFDEI
jgi:hypothetical protein